jgi:hypothetical integral membrane protein (TIGR02206 family)
VRFGPDHDLALALIALTVLAAVTTARVGSEEIRRALRLGLATVMVSGSLAEMAFGLAFAHEPWQDVAPLQLCDLTLMLGAFTLVTLNRRTLEPLYFFAMMGTLPALFFPELPCAHATDFRFIAYFGLHGLTMVAVLTLVAGFGLVPGRGAWWRALLWLNAWAALVSVVNVLAGTNYLYLRAKPTVPTPFDWMGTGVLYVPSLELAAGVVFLALQAVLIPVRAASRRRRSSRGRLHPPASIARHGAPRRRRSAGRRSAGHSADAASRRILSIRLRRRGSSRTGATRGERSMRSAA